MKNESSAIYETVRIEEEIREILGPFEASSIKYTSAKWWCMVARVTLFCKKFSESRDQAFFPFLRS